MNADWVKMYTLRGGRIHDNVLDTIPTCCRCRAADSSSPFLWWEAWRRISSTFGLTHPRPLISLLPRGLQARVISPARRFR